MANRFIKQTAIAALLTTSVLSFSPVALGASNSVDKSISNVKTELNQATTKYVYPALDGKLATSDTLYPVLNSAKKNYQNTVKAIQASTLSQKEKQAKLKEIETLYNEKITKGLVPYIDAYNYATKYLDPLLAEIKVAEAKNDFAAVEKAYHQLSYQLKGRTAILYRFSGKASRDLLLDKYKQPSDQKRDELMVPVTIYMKTVEIEKLVKDNKLDEAKKVMESILVLVDRLPNSATNTFVNALLKEVEKVQEKVTPVTPPTAGGSGGGGGGGGIVTPPGNAPLNALLKAQIEAAETAASGAVKISMSGNNFTVNIASPSTTLGEFETTAHTIFDDNKSQIVVNSATVKYGTTTISDTDVTNYTNFADVISNAFRKLGNGMSLNTEISFLLGKSITFQVEGTIEGKAFNDQYKFTFIKSEQE